MNFFQRAIGRLLKVATLPASGQEGDIVYAADTHVASIRTDSAWVTVDTGVVGAVTSVTGTANQIDVATGTTTPVLTLSSTLVAPGTVTATTSLTSPSATLTGTVGLGFIDLAVQSSPPSTPASNHIRIFNTSVNKFGWIGASGNVRTFDGTLTASRSYTLPDSDTSIPIIPQTLTITGPTTARSYALPDANATILTSGGALGTPSSGTLTNTTGLPVSTGISGLGTGVATALATANNTIGGYSPIDGTAELTNKTLNASVGKGIWTASGTWTLPAFTLGGAVSGGGNQINNVVIGASTPLAGSFTTLAASGAITQTSASATAFESGPNGSTNPVFRLVNSVSSAATGLSITGNASGSGVTLTALGGTNENITLTPKGSGAAGGHVVVTTQIRAGAGDSSFPSYSFSAATTVGFSLFSGTIITNIAGASTIQTTSAAQLLGSGILQGWTNSANPAAGTVDTNISRNAAGVVQIGTTAANALGSLSLTGITMATAGTFTVSSGTNKRAGNATLVGGTVTVSNTTVTANTIVMLTRKTSGGTIGTAITYTLSAGTSFTINSDNILDTSSFSYFLIKNP